MRAVDPRGIASGRPGEALRSYTSPVEGADRPTSEAELVGIAVALGALTVGEISAAEQAFVGDAVDVAGIRRTIATGADPLGDAFCRLRTPERRRRDGATYTPGALVDAMVAMVADGPPPQRIIDPGVGSGRFLVAAGRAFPGARLVGIDTDPVATLLARGHLAAAGMAERAEIRVGDYREMLVESGERTLFLGNPPYVRHHGIGPGWKRWLAREAGRLGVRASALAGLHAHFFLATARVAKAGDRGCFVTAAEWLDVNYGSLVRELLLGPLGVESITLVDPEAGPFPDALTTAVIVRFAVGTRAEEIGVASVGSVAEVGGSMRAIARGELERATRWRAIVRGVGSRGGAPSVAPRQRDPAAQRSPAGAERHLPPEGGGREGPSPVSEFSPVVSGLGAPSGASPHLPEGGLVELGEVCRVHRGQVTGANAFWIAGPHAADLPDAVLFPTVTRARELFAAGPALATSRDLRRVVDLPVDLDALDPAIRPVIERFLARARARGVPSGYIARSRRAWWSVGLREPAPILATYMARRPPAFVRNLAGARHVNIAHGLYPREPFPAAYLDRLAAYLSGAVMLSEGRTYAGGLTKFEPREMERLRVPAPR